MTQALMVVGATSHAGKSLLCAAICRMLSRRGWRVSPFKGQNMALNAYVTDAGDEIGYAQAVQAWAAGVEPTVEMNPILLKPQGDMTSQVILNGKAVGRTQAQQYYEQYFDRGWEAIKTALGKLQQKYDYIVCEGAGSPAEINLMHRDLTNMRVAEYLNADTLLVVDIERGGSFAHIIGTLKILKHANAGHHLVKGILINKFRGQESILQPGIDWVENYTGIPVVGVIPYLQQVFPAEDSLDLLERRGRKRNTDLTIAVIHLSKISNFTDFDPLEAETSVNMRYVRPQDTLGNPDAVILPGSKTTIADLQALQTTGMASALQAYAKNGGVIFGICGGFQILGETLSDPDGLEGEAGNYNGLGLFPLKTTITSEKMTRQRTVKSIFPESESPITGYEIHQGRTAFTTQSETLTPLFEDAELGYVNSDQSVWGCYLHGLFENGTWRRQWLNQLRQKKGLFPLETNVPHHRQQREEVLDAVTDIIENHLDLTPY
ncbi:adenosylcobyric acid synthase (glutamine-hydrolysing) [Halothece sp. PCC 7418]|uniref:cobyric acid synthase CobQ n=1 Tax=Halothece sp. (strain PCC 7418) TaxID=65093 RepID=UPI0002A07712|nr:cobyric acid synthase CobQ [Halothece sp. PCC 7418]AFZ42875.1 adenosylcobyric acid synthase (glutamine-hydrolysing) [Halothece sp. PCC 7418]